MKAGYARVENKQVLLYSSAMEYEPVIGMEVHAHLRTKTKMFCDCANDPDEQHPNVNVCPVCMGHPGTLPVINREAVREIWRIGAALHAKLAPYAKFDRKNYFYPDLPKGYQISQYDLPLVTNGSLAVDGHTVRIRRVHLEEDAGRLQHDPSGAYSLVDYNRAGVPLMEMVTEPDLRFGKEAREFCEAFQLILRYLGASNANMEKGEMRCEVNISLREPGGEFGTKVEIKNLNSFRAVERAIEFEITRQSELLGKGEKVAQETRGWDEKRGVTFSQRTKEAAEDYRYFPEPDLPPLRNPFSREEIIASLPELPAAKQMRFAHEYGIPEHDIAILIREKPIADYYEAVVSELFGWMNESETGYDRSVIAKLAANYCITELQKLIREHEAEIEGLKVTPENFAELIKMIVRKEISSSGAQTILLEMFRSGGDPSTIAGEKNLLQVSDAGILGATVEKVLNENPQPASDYRKGKENALQFLVGQVMKETRRSADPGEVQRLLKEKLLAPHSDLRSFHTDL